VKYKAPIEFNDFQCLNPEKPMIIYSFQTIAFLVFYALKKRGMSVDFFCDNNTELKEYDGVPIIHTNELKQKCPEANIVIASKYYTSAKDILIASGYTDTEIVPASVLLSSFELSIDDIPNKVYNMTFHFPGTDKELVEKVNLYYYGLARYYKPSSVLLPSLDVVVTERCSLRCRDCSNLMQYYTNPQDVDFDNLCNALGRILDVSDHICELRILGGEPLLYKKLPELLQFIKNYSNIGNVVILSNATIFPDEGLLNSLRNTDIIVSLTNYNGISKKSLEIKRYFEDANVKVNYSTALSWNKCGYFVLDKNNTACELSSRYNACCAQDMVTLLHGKLYPCPFAANAENLKAIPIREHLDVLDTTFSKNKLREFCYKSSYVNACIYCPGRDPSVPLVAPAEQTKKPLNYHKFE
jgi:sulfatase maturation enzyme AslB (radical SAM superfamily)